MAKVSRLWYQALLENSPEYKTKCRSFINPNSACQCKTAKCKFVGSIQDVYGNTWLGAFVLYDNICSIPHVIGECSQ